MNRYQIDVVNTYACNVAVDENEDHEPSIKKCTQYDKWPKREKKTIDAKIKSLGKTEYLNK